MIVLNKKNKLWELYPIGHLKGALNSMRTPKFIGTLKFKRNNLNKYVLNRFIVVKDDEEKFYPPSVALKILKKQVVFLSSHDSDMEEFLSSQDIKFRFTKICKQCSYNGIITIINDDSAFEYHNQKICKKCSENIIKEELKLNGIDKKLLKRFKQILDKKKDLSLVLKIINSKFDPIKDTNLTFFDKIESKDNRKFPKIPVSRLKVPNDFKKIIDDDGNNYLLPIQFLAIKEGLLQGKNLLVVSATGSGKTLIGELAGINNLYKNKKFIYLTPLVALANQKYRDFKRK
ncbi:MAG: DEAD/DEAH box helicase, partial [Methanobrevibacter sp.]|nr:DEAD/DEAH box helicase [Methanobrevibacter sp.]